MELLFTVLIVPLTAIILSLIRNKSKRTERKRVLDSWVKAAVQKRDLKQHSCLGDGTLEESKQDEHTATFYSAKDTQSLVSVGKISAADNLKLLAARCHRLGRNNSSDTGINAITEEFYDEVRDCIVHGAYLTYVNLGLLECPRIPLIVNIFSH